MTPSLHHGQSPSLTMETVEQDEENNQHGRSSNLRRRPLQQQQQLTPSRPVTPAIASSRATASSTTRTHHHHHQQHNHHHHHHHHHQLPLNVLLSGWTKLEAVQRWVVERTLEYIPHPHYHLSSTSSSSAVQRVLKDAELVQLEEKYKDQIRVDQELQALQKQIRTARQQLHDKRRERERLERKHLAQREREQKALDAQVVKLKQALDATEKSSSSKNRREYAKALQRAGHRKNQGKRQSSFYKKIIAQPLTAIAASTTSSITGNSAGSTNWATGDIEEKEALTLETTILRNMHQTLVYQNQCDVAQKYDQEITSALKRSRAQVDNDRAEISMFQMVLEGTSHALAGLYPEIASRQENLIERLNHGNMQIVPRRTVPRIIVPKSVVHHRQNHHLKRFSFASSGSNNSSRNNNLSISDLGESDDNSSTNKEYYSSSYDHDAPFATSVAANGYSRRNFPVFTSVEKLQQQTLQSRVLK